jgi:hypothetical protein
MKDFKTEDGDLVFNVAGELEVVEGGACVAQDASTAFSTAIGSLHWDRTAGSSFPELVNGPTIDTAAVESEAENLLVSDDRIDPDGISVAASINDDGGLHIAAEFTVSEAGIERAEADL